MKLRTVVRDCLYLNWALPLAALPVAPAPLRYEAHEWQGERYAFASAVLFRQHGLRLAALPLPRFSYPQLNLRLYVLDGEGVPSVLFVGMLMPAWALPGAWLARQPAAAASLDYPRPSAGAVEGAADGAGGDAAWRWSVERHGRLEVAAVPAAPAVGEGPRFTSWETAVRYFRIRRRGYSALGGRLRRIEAEHPRLPVWPLRAEVLEASLLARLLPLDGWPALHSAFLCPEIPFLFELAAVPSALARERAPATVAADPAMLAAARDPRQAA